MGSLVSTELSTILELQGISTETLVGAVRCPSMRDLLRGIAGGDGVVDFEDAESAVKASKTSDHFALVAPVKELRDLLHLLGGASEVSSAIGIIGLGPSDSSDPSEAALRSLGAMAVTEPTEESLRPLLCRALEFRALRALELAHRCESRRLNRREMDLLGYPPETMTDDLTTFQPPPLPVGPISTYNLEETSDAFERAYIDRVQLLCESAREAAKHLDVSAATLARRLRRDSQGA